MGELVVLCGISGSGKSTIAREIQSTQGYKVFSSDEMRRELWGDINDQRNPGLVFNELNKRVIQALKDGESIVYDATNLSSKKRERFLHLIDASCEDVEKTCAIVLAWPGICAKRVKERKERIVPLSVVRRQLLQFEAPHFYEGWDNIVVYSSDETGRFYLDYLEIFHDMSQDNAHHTLSIGAHMDKAAKILRQDDIADYIVEAAQYHDIGKYFTKTFKDKNGDCSVDAHYFNHQNVGAYLYLLANADNERPLFYSRKDGGWDDTWKVLDVAFLIQHHMDHYMRDKVGMARLYEKIGYRLTWALKLVEKADKEAH